MFYIVALLSDFLILPSRSDLDRTGRLSSDDLFDQRVVTNRPISKQKEHSPVCKEVKSVSAMQSAFIAASPIRPAGHHMFVTGHSALVSPRRPGTPSVSRGRGRNSGNGNWTMGKKAKFGPFTPAVLIARLVLGEKRLNKIRGKAISLHSQVITAFCDFTGAGPRMRQALIREAKENGSTLGFLS